MSDVGSLDALVSFVARIPAVQGAIGKGRFDDGRWWIKFSLDITHPLVWRVVQELAHVLNYLSLSERLPTVFMPVSPPAYMNGGPRDFLSWVIESKDVAFDATACIDWFEGRLPCLVDDASSWASDDE